MIRAAETRASIVSRPGAISRIAASPRRPPQQAAGSSRYEVYVAKVPLVGLETFTSLLGPMYPHQLKHSMTMVVSPDGQV